MQINGLGADIYALVSVVRCFVHGYAAAVSQSRNLVQESDRRGCERERMACKPYKVCVLDSCSVLDSCWIVVL